MHLVLIETAGNQNYIFATNKLRENVGASELTYCVGTQWALEAVREILQAEAPNGAQIPPLWHDDAQKLRENLLDPKLNPPINQPGAKVEVLVATSGKAMLLVENAELGKAIIKAVTCQALKEAPGIDVCGVISAPFAWENESLGDVVRATHQRLEQVRDCRPSAALRFLRLPVIEDCRDSGWPAEKWDRSDPNDEKERSTVSLSKRARESSKYHPSHQSGYRDRMMTLLKREQLEARFPENIGALEKDSDWLAVVHADGNGLGNIFQQFAEYIGCTNKGQNRTYVEKLRHFSIALDICTEKAFLTAAKNTLQRRPKKSSTLPILPIVLGGDDLTVVCDGQDALQFTYDFLTEFEKQTRASHELVNDIIPQIVPEGLSACAGIAIVKPHFPFSAAYDLAEELIVSAKRVKKLMAGPCSALDFHALYDSSSSELSEIRRKLRVDEDTTKLYARPYVVTCKEWLEEGATSTGDQEWALQHHWSKLQSCVAAIWAKDKDDENKRALPNSQLHDLRAGLFLRRGLAQARYDLIRERYKDKGIEKLEAEAKKLFAEDLKSDDDGKLRHFTYLLDAMDAANFWRNEDAK